MSAQIIAMGGGGFSMSKLGSPTALDHYLVEATGKRSPLVCFAPTAAADDAQYIHRFLAAYGNLGVRPMVLTLWEGAADSVKRLEDCDLLLVGAGQTVNLMALWEAHGVTEILRRRYAEKDLVLAGLGAGASIWFEGCVTDSFGPYQAWRGGLGFLAGSLCPHFDGEAERDAVFTEAIADGTLPGGYGLDDGVALHFIDGEPVKAISEKPGARALRIMPSDSPVSSGVLAEPLAIQQL